MASFTAAIHSWSAHWLAHNQPKEPFYFISYTAFFLFWFVSTSSFVGAQHSFLFRSVQFGVSKNGCRSNWSREPHRSMPIEFQLWSIFGITSKTLETYHQNVYRWQMACKTVFGKVSACPLLWYDGLIWNVWIGECSQLNEMDRSESIGGFTETFEQIGLVKIRHILR